MRKETAGAANESRAQGKSSRRAPSKTITTKGPREGTLDHVLAWTVCGEVR